MVESINEQPNDIGPNSKLGDFYNILKAKWILTYGTTRFKPHHMNYVLVETWEAFKMSAGNIIRDGLYKTHLLPLRPTNMIKNIQAYVASIQKYSKGINQIAEDSCAPIKLLMKRTNNPMVVIRAKGGTQQPSRKIVLWAAAYDTAQKQTSLPLQ